jgi:hypothetical protein
VWALAKWARERSHYAIEPPKMPPLRPSPEPEPIAFSHAEKTEALRQRFFPEIVANLEDIQDRAFDESTFRQSFEVDRVVTTDQVARVVQRTGAWKAPGRDGIPTGFLKACGEPLYRTPVVRLAQASPRAEYFPCRFRDAKVIALRKPGRTAAQLEVAGSWRPIALRNTIRKAIEAIIAEQITDAAEETISCRPTRWGPRSWQYDYSPTRSGQPGPVGPWHHSCSWISRERYATSNYWTRCEAKAILHGWFGGCKAT